MIKKIKREEENVNRPVSKNYKYLILYFYISLLDLLFGPSTCLSLNKKLPLRLE